MYKRGDLGEAERSSFIDVRSAVIKKGLLYYIVTCKNKIFIYFINFA